MPLLYRTVFSSPRATLLDDVSTAFANWVESMGVDLVIPVEGSERSESVEVIATPATTEDVSARRLEFREKRGNGLWSTTITAIDDGNDPCVWIDIERTSEDPFSRPPIVDVPQLLESLLAPGDCHVGPTILSTEPEVIGNEGVEKLVEHLISPDRRLPLVVMSKDRYATADGAQQRGRQLLRRILGLGQVYVLEADASTRLEEALGADLKVSGGAVRSYLPGLTLPDRQPSRHSVIAGTVFASQISSAASRIQRTLAQQAVAQSPPAVYRDRISTLPGFPHHASNEAQDEELLLSLVQVEAERDALLNQLKDLQDEIEFSALQLEEADGELDSAQARVRYLEGRLRSVNDQAANEPTPLSAVPESAGSCIEAISLARQYLAGVEIGDTDYPASTLDTFAKSGSWGKKAWRVFRAMEDYADLKARQEFSGDFLAYCSSGHVQGRTVVPATWIALKESESTDNNPQFRGARTFPVPVDLSDDEEIYMCAHVKIEAGGRPAPRIHFYDDTSGPTGVIHVGYFGEHLPNSQTN